MSINRPLILVKCVIVCIIKSKKLEMNKNGYRQISAKPLELCEDLWYTINVVLKERRVIF